jgi:hypothetical protein
MYEASKQAADLAGATPQAVTATALRLQRIQDLLADALDQSDPLAANLGAIGSDLALFALCVSEAITRNLADSLARLPVREMDLHLRIARQMHLLAQLQRRQPRDQVAAAPPRS